MLIPSAAIAPLSSRLPWDLARDEILDRRDPGKRRWFQAGPCYGVRPDQRIYVFHIAVVRVLGTCAGPEEPLDTSTLSSQFFEPHAGEDFLVHLVCHFRAGDGNLPAHFFARSASLPPWAIGFSRSESTSVSIRLKKKLATEANCFNRLPLIYACFKSCQYMLPPLP